MFKMGKFNFNKQKKSGQNERSGYKLMSICGVFGHIQVF